MERPLLDALADRVVAVARAPKRLAPNAHLLLADHCACVRHGTSRASGEWWLEDGVAGQAALLAIRSHASDRDDVHWAWLVHPGSVVWPAVLAVGAHQGVEAGRLVSAAAAGYEAVAAVSAMLGHGHARAWHVTATAGHAGAAAAASWLLSDDADALRRALGLALAVCGGVGQTMQERASASQFHRAAATVTGIAAARAAMTGLNPPSRVIEGDRGVLALLGGEDAAVAFPGGVLDVPAIATTSVRLFPVNGLAQSAVRAAVALRKSFAQVPEALEVLVPPAVAVATRSGGPGGRWWDLRAAVCTAFLCGDEWAVDDPAATAKETRRALYERTRIVPSELPPQAAIVRVVGREGAFSRVDLVPGLEPVAAHEDLRRKWSSMGLGGTPEVDADTILGGDVRNVLGSLLG